MARANQQFDQVDGYGDVTTLIKAMRQKIEELNDMIYELR